MYHTMYGLFHKYSIKNIIPLCGTTFITFKSDKTGFDDTHFSPISWETVRVHFIGPHCTRKILSITCQHSKAKHSEILLWAFCPSVCPSVRLSVCRTLIIVQSTLTDKLDKSSLEVAPTFFFCDLELWFIIFSYVLDSRRTTTSLRS